MVCGSIILLNGTSSSGKTTIAKILQNELEGPYLHFGLDLFFKFYFSTFPKGYSLTPFPEGLNDDELYEYRDKDDWSNKKFFSFHKTAAALAGAGNNMIIDTLFETKHILMQCLNIIKDLPVLFVGVNCSLEELEKREMERKDRRPGLAKMQFNRVHQHANYDVEVDTSKDDPMTCAKYIIDAVQSKSIGFSSK